MTTNLTDLLRPYAVRSIPKPPAERRLAEARQPKMRQAA